MGRVGRETNRVSKLDKRRETIRVGERREVRQRHVRELVRVVDGRRQERVEEPGGDRGGLFRVQVLLRLLETHDMSARTLETNERE
jgi:hypothetical protein